MLKVYAVMLRVLGMLRAVLVQIEKHDRDLGSQLRAVALQPRRFAPPGKLRPHPTRRH